MQANAINLRVSYMRIHAESVHTGEQERLRQLEIECLAGMRCFYQENAGFLAGGWCPTRRPRWKYSGNYSRDWELAIRLSLGPHATRQFIQFLVLVSMLQLWQMKVTQSHIDKLVGYVMLCVLCIYKINTASICANNIKQYKGV